MAEERLVYWLITAENVSYPTSRCYVFTTPKNITFRQFKLKASSIVYESTLTLKEITYSREDGHKGILINSDESLRIAIDYKGENAYDVRKGIVLYCM